MIIIKKDSVSFWSEGLSTHLNGNWSQPPSDQNETELMFMAKVEFQKNIPLADLTTFKIGGPAEYFCRVSNLDELKDVIVQARKMNKPIFILGSGSNLLVSDEGFKGVVIKLQSAQCIVQNLESHFKIICNAGVLLSQLLSKALDIGAKGLEWATGIPGTIGGAVFGNSGAYGHSTAEIVEEVVAMDPLTFEEKAFSQEECSFDYRESVFKKNGFIITSVALKLPKDETGEARKVVLEYIKERKNKIPPQPSAGCTFKNIPVTWAPQESLRKIPEEKIKGGKIPVGYLIDQCGLRGAKIGDAQISPLHANFIVNLGKATARDVYQLINLCKDKVQDKFSLTLEEEIRYLGNFEN